MENAYQPVEKSRTKYPLEGGGEHFKITTVLTHVPTAAGCDDREAELELGPSAGTEWRNLRDSRSILNPLIMTLVISSSL